MKRLLICLILTLMACGVSEGRVEEVAPVRGDSPLVGKADGTDAADRDCTVILRHASRIPNGPGFETGPSRSWVWSATIDVAASALDENASVHLLYSSNASNDPQLGRVWWTVEALPQAGAADGQRRFEARIEHGLFGPGMSGTSLQRATLDMIPYVARGQRRLFDHNRVAGDLDTYALRSDTGWVVAEAPAMCAPDRGPAWIGNAAVKFERGNSHPCSGARLIADSERAFEYETWARQRAVVRSLCFEAWEPGVTDWDNPDLWRTLDVQIHYRLTGDADWTTEHVNLSDRTGNNARYGFDLGAIDPLAWPGCPAILTEGRTAVVEMEFFVTVNDELLSGADGAPFVGRFTDHLSTWEQRCQ